MITLRSRIASWLLVACLAPAAHQALANCSAAASATNPWWVGGTSTAWSLAGNWNGGVPTNGDTVCIPSGTARDPTVSANTATLAGLEINGTVNGAANISVNNAAGNNITGTGTLAMTAGTVTATGNVTVGTLTMTGGTVNVAGSFTPGAFTATGGGTVNYNGAGAQTISAFNYYSLVISGAHTTNSVTLASSTIGVANTLLVSATFTSGGYVTTGNTIDFNGSGAQTIAATTATFSYNNLSTSNAGTKTLNGNVTATGVVTVGASTTLDLSTRTLTLTASGTPLAVNGTLTVSTSTVNFAGTGTQTIPALNYNSLTSSSSGTRTLASSGTIGIAATFTPGTNTYTTTGSTIDYNGGGNQNIAGFTYNNLNASNAGTKTVAGTVNVDGNLAVSGSATMAVPSQSIAVTGTTDISGTATLALTTSETPSKTFTGKVTVQSGATLNLQRSAPVFNGDVEVKGGGSLTYSSSATGTKTFNGNVLVSGTWTENVNAVITFAGNFQNDATSWTAGTGLHTFSGSTKTIKGTQTSTIANVAVDGTYTNTGTLDVNTALGGTGTLTNGDGTTSGTIFIGFTGPPGISNLSAGTCPNVVNYDSSGNQTVKATDYCDLTLSGTTTVKTVTGVSTINGNLTVSASATMSANSTLSVGGDLIYSSSGTSALANPITVTGTLNQSAGTLNGGAGTSTAITIGQLSQSAGTFNPGGNLVTVTGANGAVWSKSGTYTTTGTTDFTGAGSQIGASNFSTLQIDVGSTNTATLTGNATVAADLTVTTGTLDLGSNTANRGAAGGTLAVSNGATLRIGGTGTFPTNYSTHTLGTGVSTANCSTVEYGGSNQTVTNESYGSLTLSGSGTKTMPGTAMTVACNLATRGSAVATTVSTIAVNGTDATITTGNFSVGLGTTFTVAGTNFSVAGTTGVYGTLTHNNTTGTKTYSGDVTVISTGNWNETAAITPSFGGSLQNDGTFTASTGIHTFTGASKTLSGASGLSIPSVTVSGSYTNSITGGQSLTISTALAGGGSLTQDTSANLNLGATAANLTISTLAATATGNTVNYNGTGTQTVVGVNYYNLTISATHGANTVTLVSGGTIGVAGTFTPGANSYSVTGNTVNFNGSGAQAVPVFNYGSLTLSATHGANTVTLASGTVGVSGSFTPGANTYSIAGNTVDFNATGAQSVAVFNYNNLTISQGRGANNVTLNSGTIGIAGDFNPSATSVSYITTGNTVDFNGSGAQSTGAAFTYNNLTISNSSSTVSLGAGTSVVNATLNLGAGATLAITTNTLTLNSTVSGTGAFTSSATGTVNYNQSTNGQAVLASSYGNLTFSNNTKVLASSGTIGVAGTFTPGSGSPHTITGSTVNFNGSGAQSIPAFNYNNLTISGARGSNNVTLQGSSIIGVAGALTTTATSVTYVTTGSRVEYNGTAAQTVNNGFTYADLKINNSHASGVSLVGDTNVSATLFLTQGKVTTGSNTLAITSTNDITRTSGHVFGNLKMRFAAATITHKFEIGDATVYSPVTLNFTTVNTAGSVTLSAVAGTHPDSANGGIDPTQSPNQSVARYWSATPDGTLAFDNYSITIDYVSGELDAGLDLTTVGIGKANSCDGSTLNCTWSFPTTGTPTATQAQATGLTSFSQFAVGKKVDHFVFSPVPTPDFVNTPFSVTITAVDKNGNTVTTFTGAATIASGGCTISAGGTTSAFTGGAYTGNVTISSACTSTLTATGVSNNSITGTSNSITVVQVSSFDAFETGTTPNPGAIAGVIQTRVAGNAMSIAIVAIFSGSQATTFNADVKLELLANGTPGSNYGANRCPTTSTLLQTINPFAISGGRSNASFAAESNVYRDVRVRISFPAASPTLVVCSSDSFAIRPSGFTVSASDNNWTTAGNGRALANGGASGGNVHKAGQPFTVTTTATPATATLYDGTVTVASGGLVCTNFGGAGCANGTLSSNAITPFALSGTGIARTTNTARYLEAGVFSLTLEDVDFASIDSGDGSSYAVPQTGGAATVGRFVPDHFKFVGASTPQLQTFGSASACGRSFTYIGQSFWYVTMPSATMQAVAADDTTVTTNYRGTLFHAVAAENYSSATGPALVTGSIGSAVFTPGNGTAAYAASNSGTLSYTRDPATPAAAFNADISLSVSASDTTEADGTIGTNTPQSFSSIGFDSGAAFRYGRLRLLPAAGPTTMALPVPIRTEYWSGTGFLTNSLDNCTSIPQANVTSSNFTAPLSSVTVTPATITFTQGTGKMVLAAPGINNRGSVTLTINLTGLGATFLQGAWTGATYTENPSARAAFGVFGAQPREFIFQRENY